MRKIRVLMAIFVFTQFLVMGLTEIPTHAAAPATPPNVTAVVSGNKITIKWTPVANATKYEVNLIGDYRQTASTATSYTYSGLEYNKLYDYNVRAYNGSQVSAWSPTKEIWTGSSTVTNPTIQFVKGGDQMLFSNNPEQLSSVYANKVTYMTGLSAGTYDFHLEHSNKTTGNIKFAVLFWNNSKSTSYVTPLQSGTCGATYSQVTAARNYRTNGIKATVTIPPGQGRWFYYTNFQFVGDQKAIFDMAGHAINIPKDQVFEGHFKFKITGGDLRFKSGCYTGSTPATIQNATYTGLADKTDNDRYTYSGRTVQNTVTADLKFTIPSNAGSGMLLPVNLYNPNTNPATTVIGAKKWTTHLYDYAHYNEPLVMSDLVDTYIGKDYIDGGAKGQFFVAQGAGRTAYLWDVWNTKRAGRAWNWANWYIPTRYNFTFYNDSSIGKTVEYWIGNSRDSVVEYEQGGVYNYARLGPGAADAKVASVYVGPKSTVKMSASVTLLGNSSGGISNYVKVK